MCGLVTLFPMVLGWGLGGRHPSNNPPFLTIIPASHHPQEHFKSQIDFMAARLLQAEQTAAAAPGAAGT